jgi:hypothetical protein
MKTLFIALMMAIPLLHAAGPFHFEVFRTKLPRNEPGALDMNEGGISYRSDDGKTEYALPFADIREADVSVPGRIRLRTFDVTKRRLGGNKELVFRLREGAQDEALGHFLAEHLVRPVVGSYGLSQKNAYQIPAYHRGALSGSHGTLTIGSTGIEFSSKKEKDSRTWLYRDIQTVGTPDPFRFRVTTYVETFTFDLKERLPEEAYRLAWQEVYNLVEKTQQPAK